MALIKQSDCDALLEYGITQELEEDGTTHKHFHHRFVNANKVHGRFIDVDSDSDSDDLTLRAYGFAFMQAYCEMKDAVTATQTVPRDILNA